MVSLVSLVALALLGSSPGAAADEGGSARPRYRPPVDAPVLDPFRPPPAPWLPGNRGIEYGTVPATVVRAIGPGRVTFAGRVAGRLIVTVRHPDGLRSSYVGLATAAVSVGDQLRVGDAVGRSADRLHLGVRLGDRYLDPASLWGTPVGGGRARLVPTRRQHRLGAASQVTLGDRAAIATLVRRPTAR